MIFVKINDTLYPATVSGRVTDRDWDNRESKSITLEIDYATAIGLFVDGMAWSIMEQREVVVYDDTGVETGTEMQETEFDNSEFILAGDLTDHRDGRITAKMGKLTELEEAYEIMLGGIES